MIETNDKNVGWRGSGKLVAIVIKNKKFKSAENNSMHERNGIRIFKKDVNDIRKVFSMKFRVGNMEDFIYKTHDNANLMSNEIVGKEIKKSFRENKFTKPIKF